MDVATISQMIGSLGFPIVMCIYLVYSNNEQDKSHKETENKLVEVINNNNIALQKLTDRIDNLEKLNDIKLTTPSK